MLGAIIGDLANLMEACGLKKLINLFERYGANQIEYDYDEELIV